MPFLYTIQTLMHENSLWRTRHAIKKKVKYKTNYNEEKDGLSAQQQASFIFRYFWRHF